ncbi:MAG TPA: FtsW/RodA/SpoVE family cell cycle protein [Candidatus Pullichristensenella excrementigallinarum]|uniref:FtsW/RodA/SpoVE family cell cycle protein n=1 Tax=Candidatus Pullichristensenella excrementigallinarum TaxID=2840907 RepID=A0A9D1I9K1_9FIRM|nr:FtsW/RodA/SpoVE family cell cycle protein [Candidatus Pullichristensenella excrementigallinarum]
MTKPVSTDVMRKALMRSNTRLLLSAVMLFQFTAMLLISCQQDPLDLQALIFAGALPAATWLTTMVMGRVWPVDRAIVILAMLLCSVGIITLSDIAKSPSTPLTQGIYAGAGILAMFIGCAFIRSVRKWDKWVLPGMILCLCALLSPWVLGSWKDGARNWIVLVEDKVTLQPSEFIKPALILILAAGLAKKPRFLKCLPILAFAAACCGILLSQHDLGALLLYFLTTVLMYFVATSNWLITLSGLGLGGVAAVIAYKAFPYVQKRIAIWQNPWSDPLDSGHQIVQALIAIGSGGLFGMGLGLGTPRNIPLYHSDFIFAAIAEEFGLVFSICLLAIYVLIIMRGLVVAMNARTSFHSLTAFGIVVMLGLQTMLIVGGNTKLIPLTGVTLPMISSGGSSLVSTFLSFGILLGISSMNAEDEARDIEKLSIREEVF